MNRSCLRFALVTAVSVVAMVVTGSAQAAVITEYTGGVSGPTQMVNGPDGNVWFINGAGIAKIDASGTVTTYKVGLNPGATPYNLSNGPNNDLWFTDSGATKAIGFITMSGAIHEFTDPIAGNPGQIIAGSDGNLWFYAAGATGSIVKMSPSGGSFTSESLPGNGYIADDLVLGPDGAIWFCDQGNAAVGKIGTNGMITEYTIPGVMPIPSNITVGPDGNLWFSDDESGQIGRATTSGSVQVFSAGMQSGAIPDAITAGPDGNVWFTDQNGGQRAIGRITPSGQIKEFTTGLNQDLPLDITAGIDGNLYVPQASMGGSSPSAIAQITPAGQITELTSGVHPDGLQDGDSILAGTNGSLWFTDEVSPDAIGRIVFAPVAVSGAASAITSTTATVAGTVTPRADTTAVTVQYGTSSTELSSSATVGNALAAGTSAVAVSGGLTGLPPATTIFFRIVATNSAGATDGAIESFTTAAAAPTSQITTATLGNQRITVTTPSSSACIASSGTLAVTLASAAIAGSKSTKLKFAAARLYIDRGVKHTTRRIERRHGKRVTVKVTTFRPNATVKRLPASVALKLTGLGSGAHKLKVTFSYTETVVKHRRRTNKVVAKSVTTGFAVC
jgi:virginiamycin B lyase